VVVVSVERRKQKKRKELIASRKRYTISNIQKADGDKVTIIQ
jgi:hypothetical protein